MHNNMKWSEIWQLVIEQRNKKTKEENNEE